jgi:hypothetical protein
MATYFFFAIAAILQRSAEWQREINADYFESGTKFIATPFIQYRCPVGSGPSSKT